MCQIKVARYKDDKHEFKNGFSSCPVLTGAYSQASFARCRLQPGCEVEPKRYPLEEHNQIFVFFGGKGFITTPREAWNITEVSVFVPEFDKEPFVIRTSADYSDRKSVV